MANFKRNVNIPCQVTDKTRDFFGIIKNDSGERITPESILSVPSIKRGVEVISDAAGRCECLPYKYSDDGGKTVDTNSIAYDLLNYKSNDIDNYDVFRQIMVANAMIWGESFAYVKRDELGRPLSMHPLDPHNSWAVREYQGGILTNIIFYSNGSYYVNDDIIHLKNMSYGMCEPISLLNSFKTCIGMAQAVQRYGSLFFKNGMHASKYIKYPGWLTPAQIDAVKQSYKDDNSGVDNAHKFIGLQGGAEIGSLENDNEKSQFLGSREFTLVDASNITGCPISLLQGKGFSQYGTMEQDSLNLLNYTLDAWFTKFENELSTKLLNTRSRNKYWISFVRESLFSTDPSYREKKLVEYERGGTSWQEYRIATGQSTTRTGDYLIDPTEPEPELQEANQEVVEPAANTDQLRSVVTAVLKRFRNRLGKAIHKDKDIGKHREILCESLPTFDIEKVGLESLQAEVDAVLPEQREGVIEQWNIEDIATRLLNK